MATYYVTKAGNDGTGDGSVGNPWLTIGYGYTTMSDGDTLLVGDGTYNEKIALDDRGASVDWKTLQAINSREVLMYGFYADGAAPCNYLKIVGFAMTQAGAGISTWIATFTAAGEHSNIWFEDCEIYGGNYGLAFGQGDSLTIKNCYIHNNSVPVQFGASGLTYCTNVLIEDTEVSYILVGLENIDGITIERNVADEQMDAGIVLRRVSSHHNSDSGFDVKPAYAVFDGCIAHDNYGDGFKQWGDYVEFSNCLSYNNGLLKGLTGFLLAGDNVTLDHCTSIGNYYGVRCNQSALLGQSPSTLTITNSILCTVTDSASTSRVIYTDNGAGTPDLDYCVFYCDDNADTLYLEYGVGTILWADRATWEDEGAFSVFGDPLLGVDYIPMAGSPALGVANDGLNIGYLGVIVNSLYESAWEAILNGELPWLTTPVTAVLISEDYTFSSSHQYLSEVSAGYRFGTPQALAGKAILSGGIASASNVSFPSVSASSPVATALLLYEATGNEATSRLVAFINAGIGLPHTPNDSDVLITWNPSGIFKV